jgi:ComF family protein
VQSRVSGLLKSTLSAVVDLIAPLQCSLCGSAEAAATGFQTCYCAECTAKLCPTPQFRCQRCSAEIGPWSTTTEGCIHCRGRKLRFESVVCLGMYDEWLRNALLSAKWSYSAVRMRSLGRLLASVQRQQLSDLGINRIVPIPQHWRQRLIRHFNPAWLIAEEIARVLHVPCDIHLLRKVRGTRPQKRVSVTQRFENQNSAFAIRDAHVVAGERILIVDDVLTTGATCSEAARMFRRAGAATCHAAVIARVLDHSA